MTASIIAWLRYRGSNGRLEASRRDTRSSVTAAVYGHLTDAFDD